MILANTTTNNNNTAHAKTCHKCFIPDVQTVVVKRDAGAKVKALTLIKYVEI